MDQFMLIDTGTHSIDTHQPDRCIAHDLANLLTILNGSLELATRHARDNPALTRHLSNMHMVSDRAAVLVEELRVSLKTDA